LAGSVPQHQAYIFAADPVIERRKNDAKMTQNDTNDAKMMQIDAK
jgi:hypothetical protein